ncbi:MAG: hypothetical protein ACREBV_08030, partial [Candidatus Zixiibacteriota bacterium]
NDYFCYAGSYSQLVGNVALDFFIVRLQVTLRLKPEQDPTQHWIGEFVTLSGVEVRHLLIFLGWIPDNDTWE